MQKKTKRIILLTILLLITISIIILLTQNTNKQIPQPLTEQAKAQYETIIGNQPYNITEAVLEPTDVNPTISAGMIPVKWNGTNWVITTQYNDWYDYTNGQPAYIMLNDGYYRSEIEREVKEEQLMENNVGTIITRTEDLGTIYMWIPRFAYNDQGEILYIKQGYSVAGTYTIPEIFTYETEKRDFSLAGIWVECNMLANTSAVNTKINDMKGPENKYGFIANTIGINANNETTYQTTVETYINALSTDEDTTVGASIARPQLGDISNTNRTILKITNSNQVEPIKGKAYYDETEGKIKIEVIYSTNTIEKILDINGKELSTNSTTADTKDELIGNGIYKFIVIDRDGNIKEITLKLEGLKIYIIPDLETLKKFRDEVNAGNDFSGITVIQTADIAMNEGKYTIDEKTGDITFEEDVEQWVPIANYAKNTNLEFRGIYEGQGHAISGIYINSSNNYQGLFGLLNGTIYNLTIKKSEINGDRYVGGISGYNTLDSSIEGCANESKISGNSNIGGISGNGGSFFKCYNKGKISVAKNYAGGICGGDANIIINCYNVGNILSTLDNSATNIAGIARKR